MYQERLTKLREWLAANHYNGFLIPRGDEFLNKITAPYAERLQWASGFAGSAGLLVVTPHEAVLFTDSRYAERARSEIDPKLFQVIDTADLSLEMWLGMHALPGQVFAYDPWLYSFSQIDCYGERLKSKGILFEPVPLNPVDLFWEEQPSRGTNPLWVHPLTYAGETSEAKRNQFCNALGSDECLFIAGGDTLAWLLNIRGSDIKNAPIPHAYGLLEASGKAHFFIDLQKVTEEVTQSLGSGVAFWGIDQLGSSLCSLIAGKKVILDPKETPSALGQLIHNSGGEIVFRSNPFALPKAIKNAVELAQIRESHLVDGVALARFFHWVETEAIQEGLGEWDLAQRLYAFKKKGAHYWSESFEAIVGFADHGAIIHYQPFFETQNLLEHRSLLLVDTGTQYSNGTTTDVTRTVALGDPTDEERETFTRVLKGHIALSRVVFPEKTRGIHLEALGRIFLWESGLDYPHSTGHGVGSFLNVHEGPHGLSRQDDHINLVPSMVVTIEPGYYKGGHFGVRLENMVEVVEKKIGEKGTRFLGFVPLTLAPFDRHLIVESLLTDPEKEWLNQYHHSVYEKLSPFLEAPVREWLERTRSLEK